MQAAHNIYVSYLKIIYIYTRICVVTLYVRTPIIITCVVVCVYILRRVVVHVSTVSRITARILGFVIFKQQQTSYVLCSTPFHKRGYICNIYRSVMREYYKNETNTMPDNDQLHTCFFSFNINKKYTVTCQCVCAVCPNLTILRHTFFASMFNTL